MEKLAAFISSCNRPLSQFNRFLTTSSVKVKLPKLQILHFTPAMNDDAINLTPYVEFI